jgi:predicted nucleic acid-binding Zn ribbon protein
MEEILDLLPAILRQTGYHHAVCEKAVCAAWNRIVGEAVSTHAVPFRLYEKRLIVLTSDATWKKQLELMSPEILFKLNRLLGSDVVLFIEYRTDPLAVAAERPQAEDVRFSRLDEIIRDLEPLVRDIADSELRAAFLRAASKCIERTEGC